ncbi:flagellar motor protein MotB [Aquibacillus halophilus]|uniref:Flagellar motor protein MotB n=1 Tax=Aquibacillus halophilus TaxID=930132 RepID=A0A6A8DMI7_9BACI|nr:flagellar motor protein MotB [Aquibacillus halophilus]MRH45021.1 flagellar motor protein MotB [Aquibacillus halophilus]
MRKRRRNHKEEEHIDESWLIPYADLLTLLLALFIVLFAMSEIDAVKYQELSRILNSEFGGGNGVLEHNNNIVELSVKTIEENTSTKSIEELSQLESLQQQIQTYIKKNDLAKVLGTKLTDEGLLISIENNVFFDPGSAKVKGDGHDIANEVSEFLYTDPPHQIVVSGHTDTIPVNNSEFSSNWDLSVMRAVNFMRLLLGNDKLDPQRFSAKGFGEHKPIAPNDSEKNRAKNRRVEVLILPNYDIKTKE